MEQGKGWRQKDLAHIGLGSCGGKPPYSEQQLGVSLGGRVLGVIASSLLLNCQYHNKQILPLAVLIWLDIEEVSFHKRHNYVMDFYG